MSLSDKKLPQKKDGNTFLRTSLIVFARMSAWIAMPVILAQVLGHWLDRAYNIGNIAIFSITGFAFLVSIFGLIREANQEYKKICAQEEKKQENKK